IPHGQCPTRRARPRQTDPPRPQWPDRHRHPERRRARSRARGRAGRLGLSHHCCTQGPPGDRSPRHADREVDAMTGWLTPAQPRAGSAFRFTGTIADVAAAGYGALFDRALSLDDHVRTRAAGIIQRVRQDGDRALRELAYSLDGVALEQLEVPRAVWRDAAAIVAPELRSALEPAARNIRRAHEAWLPAAGEVETEPGVFVGRRPDPLACVGVYAPGGRALYPSSVLMGAIPARVAGVGEIIMCSPPGPSGMPAPIMLAAAEVSGVDRVFSAGGAGGIAAMADS